MNLFSNKPYLKDILIRINYFVIALAFMSGCVKTKEIEDPFPVAKNYCSCLNEIIRKSGDSLVNIYDCEKIVFPKSRFMRIYMAFDDYNNYPSSTIDSAKNFSLEVRNIIDTMCISKIDSKKIKKISHITM